MKILELNLTAFGPFTDRALDLSAGGQGLHLIFGRNEAGKSSALRALHALLYGIPGQTTDAFLHPYDGLRLGGRLRLSTGEEFAFVRRKGNKGTLLAPDGARLDDGALDRFLGGMAADQFQKFWGIDHARLVQGGKDILAGHGDLGESLFAAGSGVSHLRALRQHLGEEAETYFAPRGHKRLINLSIGRLRELKSAQRDATVSAEDWAREDRARHDAEKTLADSTVRQEELAREKSRLERLKRVLPLLAERGELHRRLDALGDVIPLGPDFPKRRQDAESELRSADQRAERAVADLKEQEALIAGLGSSPPLAAEADAVNDLYKRLGSHRKALEDRPGLVGRRNELRAQAKRQLGELRPDVDIEDAETLRVFVGRRARIQRLAAEQVGLEGRLGAARKRLKDAGAQSEELNRVASSLPPARDPEKLMSAIEAARQRGDAEAARAKSVQATKRLTAQVAALVEKLGLPGTATARLDALRVPPATTVSRFERRARERDEGARDLAAGRQRISKLARELDAKIDALRTKKAVPTEEALKDARTRRDAAFGLLRDKWEKGRDVAEATRELLGKGKLIDLYPKSVEEADELADRLRSEADRVAELAQLLEQRQRLAADDAANGTAVLQHETTAKELDEEWRETWRHVPAAPPKIDDARAWREDFDRLVGRWAELAEAQEQQEELEAWIATQLAGLRSATASLDPAAPPAAGLAAAVSAAEKLRQRVEKDERVRADHARETRATEQAIRASEAEIQDVEGEIHAWKTRWDEAVRGLVHGGTSAPDDALVAVDGIDKALRALDEADGYHARISAIGRDADSFRVDVRLLAERLADPTVLEDGEEAVWVEGIHRRLAAVLKEDEGRRQALKLRDRLKDDVARAAEAVSSARLTLAGLRDEAQCGTDGDLALAEQRSADLRAGQADLARIEKDLVRSGDGQTIAALESEAAGADRDAIDVRLSAIGAELRDVDAAVATAHEARAAARAALQRLQGPSAASEHAENIQSTLARLRDDVVRYARLHLASTILARRIDDYRRENQVPLLLRASVHFQAMTLSGFERLEADVEEERPVLVGVRPNGTRVPAGGMSEGTVDQVFLALRLAAVEASCASGEPMPFVVDDVLVQFDDERSTAALRVLADVAAHTQVVLFTHHQHVRTSAEALVVPAGVIVHEL